MFFRMLSSFVRRFANDRAQSLPLAGDVVRASTQHVKLALDCGVDELDSRSTSYGRLTSSVFFGFMIVKTRSAATSTWSVFAGASAPRYAL